VHCVEGTVTFISVALSISSNSAPGWSLGSGQGGQHLSLSTDNHRSSSGAALRPLLVSSFL
jgi:hypothetical protein